ncbi:mitochondrial K+-H+ exchange-related-domain-containing protein [Phycomyces blakesleeanus]|uniref:Mitochondrial K+-H+ exchange-related-domain-containing protein n=1 Tax=Phycomyces blakesleeanus TaxID=4837 RepID=A0ABR3BFJ8_PHYBL
MRIFAIPILRNRWAYYCHSTLPSTSRLTKAVDWSSKKWEGLGEAKPDSWKRKLYDQGTGLMNQLDYQEWFLKSVPVKEHLEQPLRVAKVLHPSSLTDSQIQDNLDALLKEKEPYHKKYMYYSAYWVPLSCTFVVVPLVPNIPLFYNLFRLYSHYKAYKGAQHLEFLSYHNCLRYSSNPQIDEILSGVKLASSHDVVFPLELSKSADGPSSKLKLESLHQNFEGVIDLEIIDRLAKEFDTPSLEAELKRARYQILSQIAKQRFEDHNHKNE